MKLARFITLFISLTFVKISMAQENALLSTNYSQLKAIKYKYHLEIMIPGNQVPHKIDDFINIYYFKDMTLCQTPVYSAKSTKMSLTETDILNNVELTDSISYYNSLIWKKGSPDNALLYEYGAKPREIELKPQLEKMFFFNDEMFNNENQTFLNKIEENGIVLEKYYSNKKDDVSISDSTLLYFDKTFDDIEFSISKVLDDERKMKLTKAIFIYNSHFDKTLKQRIPKRKIIVELENAIVPNEKVIIDLFEEAVLKWSTN